MRARILEMSIGKESDDRYPNDLKFQVEGTIRRVREPICVVQRYYLIPSSDQYSQV